MDVRLVASTWAGTQSVSGGKVGWLAVGLCALATIPAAIRWLRVAQREHYLPGSVWRFAWRWWTSRPSGIVIGIAAVACAVTSIFLPVFAIGTAAAGAVGPIGLTLRGRTSKLVWTPRLVRLAAIFFFLQAVFVGALGALLRAPVVAAVGLLASSRVMDVACLVAEPLEKRLLRPHMDRAKARLELVAPRVIAVTGSYGKTSTKQAITHFLSGMANVVASPASFNNRAGLARAINEHLAEGTEIFVAEMGTYGPGEIAELCGWLAPEVSVITAVGPVHLERFGTEDNVLAAKSEIVEDCNVAVLATDDPRLAALADRLVESGRQVIRCSATSKDAHVFVERDGADVRVFLKGRLIDQGLESSARESNIACAIGAVIALGLSGEDAIARIGSLPATAHRLEPMPGSGGALILDDTYNSNPKGASVALSVLSQLGAPTHRRVVVTPGMVELGGLQQRENALFARSVASVATDLVIVGRTNHRALHAGVDGSSGLNVLDVATRQDAVAWVRANTGPGDVVLYENDLPDHYP